MSLPFSRIYCIPDGLQRDSQRLRSRIGRYASKFDNDVDVVERIELETGARISWRYGGYRDLDKFFREAELRDILDGITHIYMALSEKAKPKNGRLTQEAYSSQAKADEWRAFIKRTFSEEHASYEADDACNVSYVVDEAYALNRKATLAGLQGVKWDAPRAEFERAFAAMDDESQDTNGAVRAIAAAVESCVKIITGAGISSVGPREIEKHLWPIVQQTYQADAAAANASHLLLKSLGDWVNATHQYRHGQESDSAVHAPTPLAIQFLTSGAGFMRWLIGFA